jgi:DNA-binding NtrC family response regulator
MNTETMNREDVCMPDPGRLILLDTDLFFVVKVRTTLQHAGYEVQTARTVADFTRRLAEDSPALALINTAIAGVDWRAAITAARAADIPVIAFGSHVDLETQQQARQAGATRVIANSKLATDLPDIVARTLRAQQAQATDTPAGPPGASEGDG